MLQQGRCAGARGRDVRGSAHARPTPRSTGPARPAAAGARALTKHCHRDLQGGCCKGVSQPASQQWFCMLSYAVGKAICIKWHVKLRPVGIPLGRCCSVVPKAHPQGGGCQVQGTQPRWTKARAGGAQAHHTKGRPDLDHSITTLAPSLVLAPSRALYTPRTPCPVLQYTAQPHRIHAPAPHLTPPPRAPAPPPMPPARPTWHPHDCLSDLVGTRRPAVAAHVGQRVREECAGLRHAGAAAARRRVAQPAPAPAF